MEGTAPPARKTCKARKEGESTRSGPRGSVRAGSRLPPPPPPARALIGAQPPPSSPNTDGP
eukprot:1721242-Alexandrium_andersonii.AAC.1